MIRAVITGAASGIGQQFAVALARKRAQIVVADIRPDATDETVRLIRQLGGRAKVIGCDVGAADDVHALAEHALAWLGEVDLLVNNAGVLVAGEVATLSLDDFKRVIDVNLWGVVHGCAAFLPAMKKRGAGRIINVASLAGAIPLPFMGAYNATKAAVIALSETMHAEGIAVTVLCPSFTQSNFLDTSTGTMTDGTMSAAQQIMKWMGSAPCDVAHVALEASRRGELYAVPTVHGRLAWWAKRIAPEGMTRALGVAHRFVPGP